MASWRLNGRSINRIHGIRPVLLFVIADSLSHEACPCDFGIPEYGGKRTEAEQYQLFIDEVSQKSGKPGDESKHQSGDAFDVFAYLNGKASWDKDLLEKLARHIQWVALTKYNVRLRWGGDWDNDGIRVDYDGNESFFDGGHFEIME